MAVTVWDFLCFLKNPQGSNPSFVFLILNQPILSDQELVKSLWRKGDVRVLADGGSNRWLNFIEKHSDSNFENPDFISGDFDSIKPETRAYFENKKVKFISTIDQDETDFTKALRCINEMVMRKNLTIKWVIVLCENSGRFDQIIANVNTLHCSDTILGNVPVIILSSQSVTWLLHPGNHTIHVTNEFIEAQYSCGLVPFCGSTTVSTSGLKWNLDNEETVMGRLVSTSNTFVAKEVRVVCDRDLVWTTQYNPIK